MKPMPKLEPITESLRPEVAQAFRISMLDSDDPNDIVSVYFLKDGRLEINSFFDYTTLHPGHVHVLRQLLNQFYGSYELSRVTPELREHLRIIVDQSMEEERRHYEECGVTEQEGHIYESLRFVEAWLEDLKEAEKGFGFNGKR